MFSDHSSYETGINQNEHLPKSAKDINLFRNSNISGRFVCDFSIGEDPFKLFAKKELWEPKEVTEQVQISTAISVHENNYKKSMIITNGLFYSKRTPNGGGITVAYNRENQRCYISRSSR